MITVRFERPDDIRAIRSLNEQTFGRPTEANVVDRLRQTCGDCLSLVAEEDDRLVGHILFSPTIVESSERSIEGIGLAPMAVLPGHQRQGIGSALVGRGLEILRERNCPFIVVLGHPEYYPRFGFEPATQYGLVCQWEGVPNEAFMALILNDSAMDGVSGVVRYRHEFNETM